MSADDILSRLDKVKDKGGGKYIACCPIHNDKTPSLAIRETEDGTVLLHCFGCGASGLDVVLALGFESSDLFPPETRQKKRERQLFPAAQVLECLREQSSILAIGAYQMACGNIISVDDAEKIIKAHMLVREAAEYGEY